MQVLDTFGLAPANRRLWRHLRGRERRSFRLQQRRRVEHLRDRVQGSGLHQWPTDGPRQVRGGQAERHRWFSKTSRAQQRDAGRAEAELRPEGRVAAGSQLDPAGVVPQHLGYPSELVSWSIRGQMTPRGFERRRVQGQPMRSTMKRKAAAAVVLAAFTWQAPALAEITLAEKDGWKVSTDGRVNAFISYARGNGIPEGQTDFPGATTKDTKDSQEQAALDAYSQRVFGEHPGFHGREAGSQRPQGDGASRALDEHRGHANEEHAGRRGPSRGVRQARGFLGQPARR